MKFNLLAYTTLVLGLAQAVLIILKLADESNLSWLVSLTPLGIPALFLLCLRLSCFVFGGIYYIFTYSGDNE